MPIGWNPALNDLITLLAGLYPDRDSARFVLKNAGLDNIRLNLSSAPGIIWIHVIEEANRLDTAPAFHA